MELSLTNGGVVACKDGKPLARYYVSSTYGMYICRLILVSKAVEGEYPKYIDVFKRMGPDYKVRPTDASLPYELSGSKQLLDACTDRECLNDRIRKQVVRLLREVDLKKESEEIIKTVVDGLTKQL